MKTIQELIRDAENLNRFMTDAAANKVQNHQLAATDDEYARNVYLTLLVSVAETAGNVDETTDNPFAYICRIATALSAVDMEEIFRRSLLLDEKILNDHAVTLRQYGLQNLLLFDALNMLIVYAKDNAATSEYIAGLANVFGTGQDGLEEILLIVKAVINREENFSYKFQHLEIEKDFLPMLRRLMKNISVETNDIFVVEFAEQTDMTEKLPLNISGKKMMSFRNLYIHDAKKIFHMSDCEEITFTDCRFYNIRYFSNETMFRFVNVRDASFIRCQFENLFGKRNESLVVERIIPEVTREGIIANLRNSDISFRDVSFKNCYYLNYRDEGVGRIGYVRFHGIPNALGALISSNGGGQVFVHDENDTYFGRVSFSLIKGRECIWLRDENERFLTRSDEGYVWRDGDCTFEESAYFVAKEL